MAEKLEFYTFNIDLNLNALQEKFMNDVSQHIEMHNVWFQETLEEIERKAKNSQCLSAGDVHVKTPLLRKRKTVLSTAKKLLASKNSNKKKKKRRTGADSKESLAENTQSKENCQDGVQSVNRELFADEDALGSSPIESKWKIKQYGRASRAVFRETLIKNKHEPDEVKKLEGSRRVTRSMRQTICDQKSDGSSSEKAKFSPEVVEIDKVERKESVSDENSENNESLSPLKLNGHNASPPRVIEVIEIKPENLVTPASAGSPEITPEKFVTPKTTGKHSENEWLTDDESYHEIESTPQQGKEIAPTIKRASVNRLSSQKLLKTQIPTTTRMTRAQTRLQAQTAVQNKVVTRTMQKNIIASGGSGNSTGSESSSKNYGSSAKSQRSVSRLKTQGSAMKGLTESAAKRREEERQRRIILLQKSVEKESKVLEKKEKFIKQRVMENKLKREEKQKRVQQIREQQEKEKEEKRRQELERKEEIERRYKQREESKKALLAERQQVLAAKMAEADQRKVKEKNERLEKLQKMEELNKKREEEMMRRKQEEERIAALCQQHNNSLQQKAMANSLLKKAAENPKIFAPMPPKAALDKTYTKDDSQVECFGYQLTPPPKSIKKPPNPEDYDITDIKSDDDTDDERKPKKPIPNWAKGSQFIEALNAQFGKPLKHREKIIRKIFKPVVLPVDLGDIFQGHRPVATRYAKRTSSAIWASPPLKAGNMSFSTDSSDVFNE